MSASPNEHAAQAVLMNNHSQHAAQAAHHSQQAEQAVEHSQQSAESTFPKVPSSVAVSDAAVSGAQTYPQSHDPHERSLGLPLLIFHLQAGLPKVGAANSPPGLAAPTLGLTRHLVEEQHTESLSAFSDISVLRSAPKCCTRYFSHPRHCFLRVCAERLGRSHTGPLRLFRQLRLLA
jgi:hypothetical protein